MTCFVKCACLLIAFSISALAQSPNWKRDFVYVKGGTDTVAVEHTDPEKTLLAVTEIKGFYLATTCVSVFEYQFFCRKTNRKMPPAPPWGWGDVKKPMVNISQNDALDYCDWFFDEYDLKTRLPTDNEWIYASHNGNFRDLYDYARPNIEIYAEFSENNRVTGEPNCITCKQPNSLGIYDMWGNVWEWVDGIFYTIGEEREMPGEDQGMIIGGSYHNTQNDMHSDTKEIINKNEQRKDVGFRVAVSKAEWKAKFENTATETDCNNLTVVNEYLLKIQQTVNSTQLSALQKTTLLDTLILKGSKYENLIANCLKKYEPNDDEANSLQQKFRFILQSAALFKSDVKQDNYNENDSSGNEKKYLNYHIPYFIERVNYYIQKTKQ